MFKFSIVAVNYMSLLRQQKKKTNKQTKRKWIVLGTKLEYENDLMTKFGDYSESSL